MSGGFGSVTRIQKSRVTRLGLGFGLFLWSLVPFTADAQQVELIRQPYLQIGDAPLDGFGSSQTDQVVIMWQASTPDVGDFDAEWRAVGNDTWTEVSDIQSEFVDVGRYNFYAEILGLPFDREYEYRVDHVGTNYQSTFWTRLSPSDTSEFTFAAYGDSADPDHVDQFNAVQGGINQTNAAFALLLGDNAYDNGTHTEFDTRFDPVNASEALVWNQKPYRLRSCWKPRCLHR